MPYNFCPWRPCGNFHQAHSLFPYLFPRSSFRVFNLVGFLCLNFFLGRPFGFSTLQAFLSSSLFFSFLNIVLPKPFHVDWRSISSPSKFVILVALPNMIFLIIKGPYHLGFIFPLGSKVSSLCTFRTRFPSLRFLGFTFLLNALAILL